jgi:hypothetical protein
MNLKHLILIPVIFISLFSNAQELRDSSSANKIKHDLGFNTILLIKQVISNSPSNLNVMQPYQVIYTMHYGKVGLRAGMGVGQSKTETSITGQTIPRTTNFIDLAGRLGANYNFLTNKRITCNAFVDGVYQNSKLKTVNTSTFTSGGFGGGQVSTQVFTSENKSSAVGGQVGFGIKYSIAKHLALYAEVPLQFTTVSSSESSNTVVNGVLQGNSVVSSSTKGANTQVFLPTTLYLLITF